MRERGTGRLFQRGSIWWMQYQVRGRQVRESSGTAEKSKAAKKLRKRIGGIDNGIEPEDGSLRYEDLRETFFADYKANKRKSLRKDKNGELYLDKVNRLTDFFDGERVTKITTTLIRAFILDQQDRGLSNGTINRSLSALRRMFNIAREDGRIRNVPHFPMLKEAAPRNGFFERADYERLSRELPAHLRLPLALGFFGAMRLSEILNLTWDQVDFLNAAIVLRAGETKNDGARTVPLAPPLLSLLKEQRGRRSKECPFVCFKSDRLGRCAKITSFRKAWYSACIRAGLGKMVPAREGAKTELVYTGKIFHDLRRSAVRCLVRSGVSERVAMKISGHETRSTFDRYDITGDADIVDAAKKLADFHSERDSSGTMTQPIAVENVLTN